MAQVQSGISVLLRRPGRPLVADNPRALVQHESLRAAIRSCGVAVTSLDAAPQFPRGCFIGDVAVVTPQLAVFGNFADSDARQGEQPGVAAVLAGNRFLKFVTAPGHLDARDVLCADGRFIIAVSARTDHEGAAQLAFFLKDFGHDVQVIDLRGEEFRLGDSVVDLGGSRLLLREELARHFAFIGWDKITVGPEERAAAAALAVNGSVIIPSGHVRVADELRLLGMPVIEVDVSAFEGAGGRLRSLALVLPEPQRGQAALPGEPQRAA